MVDKSSAARFAQIAALTLLAVSGLAAAARADDEYGTNRETVIRQAAASSGATLIVVASSLPIVGERPDVAAANGRQDELARQLYRPGSGTDW